MIQGIIFDMDGTLVKGVMDFHALRTELRIPPDHGILEFIHAAEPQHGRRMMDVLETRELAAAAAAPLMPGAAEVIALADSMTIPTALLTRNTRAAVDTVLQRFPLLRFRTIRTRECPPVKPDPGSIRAICREWNVPAGSVLCVGDFHFDITAANRAGAVSVLLAPETLPPYAEAACHIIRSLHDLSPMIRSGRL